jgi:hypothetical protein
VSADSVLLRRATAVALVAGPALVGLETVVVSSAFWIAGAIVFLVGGASVGGTVFRRSESG